MGIPSGVDPDYTKRHPDWRAAFAEIERTLYEQCVKDHYAGAKIQLVDDSWINPDDITRGELREVCHGRAVKILEAAIMRDSDPIETGRGLGALH